MCEPISIGIAGLALAAGGTLYSASQQAGYAADRNKAEQQKQQVSQAARDAERQRQAVLEKQAMDNWNAELQKQGAGQVEEVAKTGEQAAQDTTQQIQTTTNAEQGLLPGQTGSQVSDVFTGDANRQMKERMADARTRIAALSKLSGYDRANGYTSSTSNLFNADQGLLQAQAKRSLGLGVQQGQVQAPWVTEPDLTLGQSATSLGNLGLTIAGGGKESVSNLANTFSGLF